jgi:hypothetical protein
MHRKTTIGALALCVALACCEGEIDADESDAATRDASAPDASSGDAALADATTPPSDAADGDAAADSGPAPGDCAGALLCDDFESYDVGAPPTGPWTATTNRASIAVDETRAFSGARAVRFVTDGGDGTYRRAFIQVSGAPVFPVAENTVYGRMMIYVAELPGTARVHWTNIQAEGPIPGRDGVTALYRYGGMNDDRWLANYETRGAGSDCWRNSASRMEAARWTCMEWRFSQPEDRMDLWVDGVAITDATVEDEGDGCVDSSWDGHWYGGAWDRMLLGWEHYQASIAHEVWIDDVALDDERIGCPAM